MATALPALLSMLSSAKSDEQKFAGLLIVTRVVDASDHTAVKQVAESVGFPFITRLLRAATAPPDCPPYMYHSLALSVLAAFAGVPDLAASDDLVNVTPKVVSTLTRLVSSRGRLLEQPELQMVADSVSIIQAVSAASQHGRHTLLVASCFDVLASIDIFIADQEALASTSAQPDATSDGISTIDPQIQEESAKQRVGVIKMAMHTLSLFPNLARNDEHKCNTAQTCTAIEAVSRIFSARDDELKFAACKLIVGLLEFTHSISADGSILHQSLKSHRTWSQSIAVGLKRLLSNRLGSKERALALGLAAAVAELLGMEWLILPGGKDGEWDQSLFMLLVHMVCIEGRMHLEDRTLEQVHEAGRLVTGCFVLIEEIIQFVSESAGDDEPTTNKKPAISSDNYTKFRQPLLDSVLAIVHLFAALYESCETKPEAYQIYINDPIVVGGVRVIGAWLAEEATMSMEEFTTILPFLFKLVETDADDSTLLNFLLPGLCHLTTDDTSRSVLLAHGIVPLLAPRLLQSVEVSGPKDAVCSVLVNICVLAPSYVSGSSDCSQLLTALLDFITANVTDADIFSGFESPLYAAHLFVISLFILLHTPHREGVAKFFACVARFIVYGFTSKETVWGDISELELLAMQVFGAISTKYNIEVSAALSESQFLANASKVGMRVLCSLDNDLLARSL